jgi:acyl CoA:acetate/3-ketoacid CoA transferase alpha subunit
MSKVRLSAFEAVADVDRDGMTIEVEFSPQGTPAERLRAGGAGIPATRSQP